MDQMASPGYRGTHLVPGLLLGAQEELRVPVQLATRFQFQ